VGVVEACLRTLLCVASGSEASAGELVAKYDVVARVLGVMRAADFDLGVQLVGAQMLQALAANPAPAVSGAVVASDAALALCNAAETHKGALLGALSAGTAALNAFAVPNAPPAAVLDALAAALDGKGAQAVALLTRIMDCLQLVASPRAVKALLELGTPGLATSVLGGGMALLNALVAGAGRCAMQGCKASTRAVGCDCRHCRHRFCYEHGLPEVHGCGDAARGAARSRWEGGAGAAAAGGGPPAAKPLQGWQRTAVESKLHKALDAAAAGRAPAARKEGS
jgi:hypothetical protein